MYKYEKCCFLLQNCWIVPSSRRESIGSEPLPHKMAGYIEQEVELSEGHESDSGASEPVAKKAKKSKEKKRRHQISSDEEEEEDEGDEEEMRDFIVNEGDEEGGDEGGEADAGDESEKGSDVSDDLLDDDLDLLNENYQNTRGRVEISDDEEDVRERIKDRIFGPEYGDEGRVEQPQYPQNYDEDESRSESEQSEDQFIVEDDEDRRAERRHKRKGKKNAVSDQTLDDAKEIFGVDNLGEFYEDEEALEEDFEDGEEVRVAKPRGAKVTLLDTIEPSELERGFVRAEDKKIICEDRPERFQIRNIPVTEADDHDLHLEALWIHKYAFDAPTLSKQSGKGLTLLKPGGDDADAWKVEEEVPGKIQEAIRFIRNSLFEVPFIAFYRKEYVESSLLMPDLWKVYKFDEKRVQNYTTSGLEEAHALRRVTEKDFQDLTNVQTNEELMDAHAHFQLYYGHEMSRIQEWERLNTISEQSVDNELASRFKRSAKIDQYQLCVHCGLAAFAEQFGLTPEEFSENLTEYVKHEVRQVERLPNDAAVEFVKEEFLQFPSPEKVIQGAIYLLAQQFSREPAVRKKLRQVFRQHLLISLHPTLKGRDEIDENHPLYGRHYIKDKPVKELKDDEYLSFVRAQKDGIIEIDLHISSNEEGMNACLRACMENDNVPTFKRSEYSEVVEEWDKLRNHVLLICVNKLLIPVFKRESHENLVDEAKEFVMMKAAERLHGLIETEAYKPNFSYDNQDDDLPDAGTRILAICYSTDIADASFAVVINQDGECLEYQRLVHFTKRLNSFRPNESQLKKDDMKILIELIGRRQPHLVVVGGEDIDALRLVIDVRQSVGEAAQHNLKIPTQLTVEIANPDPARVYMNSRMAMQEFPKYPPLLLKAISLARFTLDPLVEICHLCNADDDILYMKFNPLQNEIPKQELLLTLHIECINRVNEVGVDINRCLEFPYTAGLLQFVCGLGPRKASHLLKILKQNENLLESRTKLVTYCRMGPKVFMNAAGFIKIDTTKVADRTDSYVEVLDGSRVHPETYEWARKMAVDALELDDPTDQTIAIEEILKAPERLKELDLDAFADELNRQVIRIFPLLMWRRCRLLSPTVADIVAPLIPFFFLPFLLLPSAGVLGCAPPGFIPSQDPAFASARCSDLILYPINAVDQSDQYRFDYSDVGFGNTHNQGATVTITCTTGGQPTTVEGFDQQRSSITSSPALIASCTNVGGSQYTWTVHARILQFVDCRI
uniref:Transcription elongation factor spt6 n=1 Tax=Globodera pallida TaxID=36090 RepID=A0A183C609_GLOPA